jgi:hypothetical protein
MSDREGGEDDVGLPKATVYKLIAGGSFWPVGRVTLLFERTTESPRRLSSI